MPPKRLPMVSTGRWNRTHAMVQASKATMDAGMRFVKRGKMSMIASVRCTECKRLPVNAGDVAEQELHAGQEFAGNGADAEAEEVLDLGGCDKNGDAVGESDDNGTRDEAYRRAETREPHGEQDDACHERDHGQAAHAETRDDAGDNDDKSASGSADLGARSAEGGDEKTSDDGGIKSRLRSNA